MIAIALLALMLAGYSVILSALLFLTAGVLALAGMISICAVVRQWWSERHDDPQLQTIGTDPDRWLPEHFPSDELLRSARLIHIASNPPDRETIRLN